MRKITGEYQSVQSLNIPNMEHDNIRLSFCPIFFGKFYLQELLFSDNSLVYCFLIYIYPQFQWITIIFLIKTAILGIHHFQTNPYWIVVHWK